MALGLAGAALLAHGSKPLFAPGRPDLFPLVMQLPADASYPSSHSAQIVGFALSLYLVLRPTVPVSGFSLGILLAWAAAVCLSRLYLQVHYPSDEVGGVLLALLWINGLDYFLRS